MHRIPTGVAVAAIFLTLTAGCEKPGADSQARAREAASTPAPSGGRPAAPFAGGGQQAAGPTDENALPLRLTGNNSLEELQAARAAAKTPEIADLFEDAFRRTFTADQSKRDYPGAEAILQKVVAMDPEFAYAYRALGYAKFNMGMQADAAHANYMKAIELKPDYGEAYYALAFLYAMGDREAGARMYRKAMELGVPDERKLGERFYPGP